MNPRTLVQPLEPRWQGILDDVLRPARLATSDVAKLAPKVEQLSVAYNNAEAEGRRTKLPLEARIAFSFPRDVPKGAGAVRECVELILRAQGRWRDAVRAFVREHGGSIAT